MYLSRGFKGGPVKEQTRRVSSSAFGPRLPSEAHHDTASGGHHCLDETAHHFMGIGDKSWIGLCACRPRYLHSTAEQR